MCIKRWLLMCVVLLASVPAASQQGEPVDFGSGRWNVTDGEVVEQLGRKCLRGTAFLKDVDFGDGVIEVDIAVDDSIRSYPGIIFRKQSESDYERFYVRPHRANGLLDDALQYVPVINGIAGWQLYSGDGFTAPATIASGEWVYLRMEIGGSQARVYLGEEADPALIIDDLKHGAGSGSIGLMAQPSGSACFSNFRYRPDGTLEFEPPARSDPPLGMLTEWELSRPFKYSKIDIERAPQAQGLTDLQWRRVEGEPSGLVDIARFIKRTPGEPDFVWARKTIHLDQPETLALSFGYSDYISIFLNGDLLFTGNSAYRSRDPSFLGIVGLNDSVYLPLHEGDNELLLLIGESFGGWGFMARDANAIYQHRDLSKVWELTRTFKFPESVQYDGQRDLLYVSNFYNQGNEFISRVKPDGTVQDLEWVTGLDRPTGLYLAGDALYVVERQNLAEIDVTTGEIAARYPIPDAGFPNDITGDPEGGAIYISDSQKNRVYRFEGGKFEVWMEGDPLAGSNGIYLDVDRLLVGCSGDGCVKAITVADKRIDTLVCLGAGSVMDGLRPDGRGNFVVSDFNGRAFLVSAAGEKTELLDTSARGIYCADLEYVAGRDLLVVPTLNDNRLVAYKLSR